MTLTIALTICLALGLFVAWVAVLRKDSMLRRSLRVVKEDAELIAAYQQAKASGQPVDIDNNEFMLPDGGVLAQVHDPSRCQGRGCTLHHPSNHHMKDWPLVWRQWDGIMNIWTGFERMCEHGIGHLDPDTANYMRSIGEEPPAHGCDGCCRGAYHGGEWPIDD